MQTYPPAALVRWYRQVLPSSKAEQSPLKKEEAWIAMVTNLSIAKVNCPLRRYGQYCTIGH